MENRCIAVTILGGLCSSRTRPGMELCGKHKNHIFWHPAPQFRIDLLKLRSLYEEISKEEERLVSLGYEPLDIQGSWMTKTGINLCNPPTDKFPPHLAKFGSLLEQIMERTTKLVSTYGVAGSNATALISNPKGLPKMYNPPNPLTLYLE